MTISKISLADYNALDAVRQSNLKKIGISPLHYLRACQSPEKARVTALTVGDATHAAILEPGRFEAEYLVYPGPVRRGKEWERWLDDHPVATVVTMKEWLQSTRIARAVRGNKLAMAHLKDGVPEATMTWTDKETGLLCKARADFLGKTSLVGLKTARNISPDAFGRVCVSLGYHIQWAFYDAGYREHDPRGLPMVEIAVENQEPHDVIVYRISEDVLDAGREPMRRYLRKVAECKASGEWPGQGALTEVDLVLPAWASGTPGEDPVLDFGTETEE